MTRKGLFRYCRLNFGINCAPELYQKIMEGILTGTGAYNFLDDIIIPGETEEIHDKRLKHVLGVLEKSDITLNRAKCVFKVPIVEFLGHTLSADGIRPSIDKLDAIKRFREPKTMEEVRSFLGLVNYIAKFLPDLATTTAPLRSLTKNDASFEWGSDQVIAFNELKNHMSNNLILGYYSKTDKTQVIADASPVGLGAVLVQINENGPRVISFASRSLSDVETRYAQTEKEALALVWAVERFHFYLFGRTFELITDHKPLEVIFGPRSKPCARIERWVLRLMSYKYKVIYKPGKTNIADPLSRLSCGHANVISQISEAAIEYVNWILTHAEPKKLSLDAIGIESKNDSSITAVRKALDENIWSDESIPFKPFQTELCFAGDILLRGNKIVIPAVQRQHILETAHLGHPGMSLMKRRMRAKVWWPKIDQDVDTFVKMCHGCTIVGAPPPPEPIKRTQLPSESWQHLALDYCGPLPSGHYLMVVIDYYSRYAEVEIMKKIDAASTIDRLHVMFARYGFPSSLTADNAKQLTCEEFKNYCSSNGIKLISTTPYWPQMNGEVERFNKFILKQLKISQAENRNWQYDLHQQLAMYRSTPHSTTLKAPGELMFNRQMRDKLPSIYQPIRIDSEFRDIDQEKKEKGKAYADDRRHAETNDVNVGDKVYVKRQIINNKLDSPFDTTIHEIVKRSGSEVTVKSLATGTCYRRNVAHVKRCPTIQSLPSIPASTPSVPATQSSVPADVSKKSSPAESQSPLPKRTRKAPARFMQ